MNGVLALLAILMLYRKHGASGTNAPSMMPRPLYRALVVLIVIGLVVIVTVPDALLVLPAFDAVGLDVVTVLVALELQRYSQEVLRLVALPALRRLGRRARHACLNLAVMAPTVTRYTLISAVSGMYLVMLAGTVLRCLAIHR